MDDVTEHYPSYRYHKTEPARVIHSADQEEEGWEESMLAHGIETAPAAPGQAAEAIVAPVEAETATQKPAKRKR